MGFWFLVSRLFERRNAPGVSMLANAALIVGEMVISAVVVSALVLAEADSRKRTKGKGPNA